MGIILRGEVSFAAAVYGQWIVCRELALIPILRRLRSVLMSVDMAAVCLVALLLGLGLGLWAEARCCCGSRD